MKTLISTLTIITILAISLILISGAITPTVTPAITPAMEFYFEEEENVDDIPFATETIAANTVKFYFEEEEYIDDIPFDTKKIANAVCNRMLK